MNRCVEDNYKDVNTSILSIQRKPSEKAECEQPTTVAKKKSWSTFGGGITIPGKRIVAVPNVHPNLGFHEGKCKDQTRDIPPNQRPSTQPAQPPQPPGPSPSTFSSRCLCLLLFSKPGSALLFAPSGRKRWKRKHRRTWEKYRPNEPKEDLGYEMTQPPENHH